jgi:VanZ family protein
MPLMLEELSTTSSARLGERHIPRSGYAPPVVAARLTTWAPVVLWAGLIFALSSIPDLGTGLGTWDLVLRKLAHAAEYGVLGALAFRALRSAPAALLLASAYAVTDEVHQAFVSGRHGSPLDWLVDTAGAFFGVVLAARFSG